MVGYGTPTLIKFSNSGQLVTSTFFGGPVLGSGNAIALDNSGNIFIGGYVGTSTFTTKNPLQPTLKGQNNGFIAKFGADMTLSYATFLGGSVYDSVRGIAVGGDGSAYVVGSTNSPDFPVKESHPRH